MAEPISVQQLKNASLDVKSLEEVVNGDESVVVTTRLGETYPSIKSVLENTISKFGFVTIDSFELGATITQRNEALRHTATGNLYRWAGDLPKVVPASSTPTSSGGFGNNAWLEVSDTTLRQDFLDPAKWKDTIKGIPFVTPEMYGAKGDGVTLDSQALEAMISAAGIGGVIQLTPNKTYLFDRKISMLDSQTLVGNSATLKREAQHVTTTTTAVTSSSSEFTVADASKFRVGQQIAIAQKGVARESLRVLTSLSTSRTITSIAGNVITTAGTVGIGAESGSTVFTAYSALNMVNGCKVFGTIFDGNKDNWSFNRWEVTCEINMASVGSTASGLIIENNTFINSPSEAIIARSSDSVISHNVFKNLNGNPVHTSNARNLVISENFGDNGNMDMAVGHQDGFVSISQQSYRIIIKNNIARNFVSGVFPLSTGNADITIADNQFYDMYCFGIGGVSTPNTIITGNRLHNIPTNTDYKTGYGSYEPLLLNSVGTGGIIVTGNSITGVVGSGYAMRAVVNHEDETVSSIITGNHFGTRVILGGHGILFADNTVENMLRIVNVRNCTVKNNKIVSGVLFSGNDEVKNLDFIDNHIAGGTNGLGFVGTSSKYENINIRGNTLTGQTGRGITIEMSAEHVKGLYIDNNTVVSGEGAAVSGFYGILVYIDGITVTRNKVIALNRVTASYGIYLGKAATAYNSLVAYDNEVRGEWTSPFTIVTGATGVIAANNVLEYADIAGVAANPETNSIVFNAPEPEPETTP